MQQSRSDESESRNINPVIAEVANFVASLAGHGVVLGLRAAVKVGEVFGGFEGLRKQASGSSSVGRVALDIERPPLTLPETQVHVSPGE
jgi:hypothetical protein